MWSRMLSFIICLFLLLLLLHLTDSLSLSMPLCHEEERMALLQFKHSLYSNKTASVYSPYGSRINNKPYACYPKVESWNLRSGRGGDCCSWNGVQCDNATGRVIGLDLGNSCLFGSINSSGSLFQLAHLQSLNLAFNNFNYSLIPSAVGRLQRLTHLNLSYSSFSGQIPPEILELSSLVSLDLSFNPAASLIQNPGLRSLIQKLTSLEELDLSYVSIQSAVPDNLAKLSSLRSLRLGGCGLHGEFPQDIFFLPSLKHLFVGVNPSLSGGLPEFHEGSPMQLLILYNTSFSGKLPSSIGNLDSLVTLEIGCCNFSGAIPTSMANLTRLSNLGLADNKFNSWTFPSWLCKLSQLYYLDLSSTNLYGEIPSPLANLTRLQYLRLSSNRLDGQFPSWLANLTSLVALEISGNNLQGQIPESIYELRSLQYLHLGDNAFTQWTFPSRIGQLPQLYFLNFSRTNVNGEIPSTLANLTRLQYLYLRSNELGGQFPSWVGNLTSLVALDISENNLQGPIPESIYELRSLQSLDVAANNLSGVVEFDKFRKNKNLLYLQLSNNRISVLFDDITNGTTFPKMKLLGLRSCNISKFPEFLRHQNELEELDLGHNNLHGPIPSWFLGTGIPNLAFISLSENFLTGFEQRLVFLPWKRLQVISLRSNRMKGPIPIPPQTTNFYDIANNSFTGSLPSALCGMNSLHLFNAAYNNLSGTIPPCFGDFGNYLVTLNLNSNRFHGAIPQAFRSGCRLKEINLRKNRLQGPLPRSLLNCTGLEVLNVENNQINDTFPFWLATLQELKILVLRSNQFHGALGGVHGEINFPKLHIIDLSCNAFSGNIPKEFFLSLKGMKLPKLNNSTYMKAGMTVMGLPYGSIYSIDMTNKGVEMTYLRILDKLVIMDFSSNRFEGMIPESLAELQGLYSLNLSNNHFTGCIPPSFGNLTGLESLDLSRNKFSGKIPVQLTRLNFLAKLNMSYNNFSGLIPHGKQFDSFQNTSYLGNPELCGSPLSMSCVEYPRKMPSPNSLSPEKDADAGSAIEFDWLVISMGYVSGLVIGLVIGCTFTARKHEWFVETFGCWQQQRERRRR